MGDFFVSDSVIASDCHTDYSVRPFLSDNASIRYSYLDGITA